MTEALPQRRGDPSTLVAHEWLEEVGGSEQVFLELRRVVGGDAMCVWNNDATGAYDDVVESPVARSPLRGHKALSLPVLPMMWRRVDLSGYERVVCSSHVFAHQLATSAARQGLAAFAYVHTPARYLWAEDVEARGRTPMARLGAPTLRWVDRRSVSPRVSYAVNSDYVGERVRRCWGMEPRTIYPPVRVAEIQSRSAWRDDLPDDEPALLERLPERFVLGASRLVEYKRLETAISAARMLGLPVVIVGDGPDAARLRAIADQQRVDARFLGRVSDRQLWAAYQAADVYVFGATEDFGMMPVECIAAGTPVVVSAEGGAQETIEHTGGGAIVDVDSESSLREGVERAMAADMVTATQRVRRFSRERFATDVADWVGA